MEHAEVAAEDPTSEDARACLTAYFTELHERFDGGFDRQTTLPFDTGQLVPPAGLLLIARLGGRPVGCGALRFHGGGVALIKRMWVHPATRGTGLGRQLLGALEQHARQAGATSIRLDSNRHLVEAIRLYRSSGYAEIENFNHEPYADFWFEKQLGS